MNTVRFLGCWALNGLLWPVEKVLDLIETAGWQVYTRVGTAWNAVHLKRLDLAFSAGR